MEINQSFEFQKRTITSETQIEHIKRGMLFQCDRIYDFEIQQDLRNSLFYFSIETLIGQIFLIRFYLNESEGYEITDHFFESDLRNMVLATDEAFRLEIINNLKSKMTYYFDLSCKAMVNVIANSEHEK